MEHDERSLDIDFGDSDDEGRECGMLTADTNMVMSGGDVVADLMAASQEIDDDVIGGRGRRREGVGGGRGDEGGRGREEMEDNGFCVLNAPTSTYVVHTLPTSVDVL